MIWHGDALDPVWREWQAHSVDLMRTRHGDQNVISPVMWPERIGLLPEQSIQSYKYDIRLRGERLAPIVVFHGSPKPHELSEPWVTEHWC
jgi:hypothetical protein